MKSLILVLIMFVATSTQAFDGVRLYTPEKVTDSQNQGPKGAVQLVWQQQIEPGVQYELQIDNGKSTYNHVGDTNFKHVMLYFNKDYRWRVRRVSRESESSFSDWRPLKVLRSVSLAQNQSFYHSSSDSEMEELFVDHGE